MSAGDVQRALVVAALPEEAAALVGRLRDEDRTGAAPVRRLSAAGGRAHVGRLGEVPCVVAVTGSGATNAAFAVTTLLEAFPVSCLVAVGCAGGLAPDLGARSVIVAREVRREDGGTLRPEPGLARAALQSVGSRPGTVVTAGRLLSTPEAKATFREAHVPDGDGRGAAVVDLESAFYAEAARAAGIPWVVLRAVSDTALERVPGFLEACRDAGGAIRRGRVAWRLVLRPWDLLPLLRLRRRVRECGEVLAVAVEGTLARWSSAEHARCAS